MAEIPVACSLGVHDMRPREEEWRSLLVPIVVERSEIPGGVRLVLERSSGTKQELERLIALEKSCCAWIGWGLREASSVLVLEATAESGEGEAVLRDWFAPRVSATIPGQ
jgi:hypothetical protein